MKKIKHYNIYFTLVLVLFFEWQSGMSQDVGINTNNPHPSAILDIVSQNKGLLVPRMTMAERNLIASPINALLIYQTDDKSGFYYYESTTSSWKLMSGTNTKIHDVDINTIVQTEKNTNENIIRFDVNGTEKLNLTENSTSPDVRVNVVNNQGNIFIGDSTAFSITSTALNHVALGKSALKNNSTGDNNIAIGTSSLSNLNESNSIGIGFEALKNTVFGDYYNIGIGYKANELGGGDANVILGSGTAPNLDAFSNIAIGKGSNGSVFSGSRNIAIGAEALNTATNTSSVTAVGYRAMFNTSALYVFNTSIGAESGYHGENNISLGYKTLSLNSSHENTAIGSLAMQNHNSGNFNQAIGYNALGSHTSGEHNIALGANAVANNVNGKYNLGVGSRALFSNLGNLNVGLGYNALSSNNNSSRFNVAIGANSLSNVNSGDRNIAIGNNANVGSVVTNSIVIGNNAYTDSSNVVILGSVEGINGANNTVQVGLGTSTPHASAIFEAKSADKAFSIPYTFSLPNAAEGAFGATTSHFYFFDGDSWEDMNPYDLYNQENALPGEAFVVRNNEVIKGYPNAIQSGETKISKATIEETVDDNKFKLKLNDEDVLTIRNNANGQLLIETLNNEKNILSGTYDIQTLSETTLLTTRNNDYYSDGNTGAGDYVFYNSSGSNSVGLGDAPFYNPISGSCDESVAVGSSAGFGMHGTGVTIIGNGIYEYNEPRLYRQKTALLGNNIVATDFNNYATAIGYSAELKCQHCVVIGEESSNGAPAFPESKVGIGISDPSSMLDIDGESTSEYPQIRLDNINTDPIILKYKNPNNNKVAFLDGRTNTNLANAEFRLGCTYHGEMLLLKGNGNAEISMLTQNSDKALKKDIIEFKSSLEKIKRISPVNYHWKGNIRISDKQLGLIAQDVKETIPELVATDDKGYLSLNYAGINVVLWEGLKELHLKLKNNEGKILDQQNRIREMKAKLQKLKNEKLISANVSKF